jgi:hypothetical protein
MGTDIVGAISHDLTFPPSPSLPQAMTDGIEPASPFIQNEWTWLEGFERETNVRAIGTRRGPTLWLGHHAVLISTGIGWDQVAEDCNLRQQILSALFTIARFFKSSHIVFLPDDVEPWCNIQDSITDYGSTLNELVASLAKIQEPSVDFKSAMKIASDHSVNGYLIMKVPD